MSSLTSSPSSAASRSSSAESFSADETWLDEDEDDEDRATVPRHLRRLLSTIWTREEEEEEALETAFLVGPGSGGAQGRLDDAALRRSGRVTGPRAERPGALRTGGMAGVQKMKKIYVLLSLFSPASLPDPPRAGEDGGRRSSTSPHSSSVFPYAPFSTSFELEEGARGAKGAVGVSS